MLTRRLRWRIVAAVAIGVTATVNFNSFLSLLSFRSAITPALQAQAAPAIDASLLSGLRWRSIGPSRGGRSIAVAGSTSRPNEYYFGATGGGLWKTDRWRSHLASRCPTDSSSRRRSARSPSPNRNPTSSTPAWAKSQLRGNVIQGDGVYKSTDAGKTWTHVGLEKTMAIGRIRVHPANPDIVYVAALGDPYGPNAGARRLQVDRRRQDAGQNVLFRNDKTGAVDLSMDPKNPDVLYAGFWEVFRTPHSLSSGGPGQRAVQDHRRRRDLDGADEEPAACRRRCGARSASRSPAPTPIGVYAIIEAAEGGVFLSDDAGATWKRSTTTAGCASARSTTRASTPTRKAQGHGLHPQHRHLSIDRRRQDAARRSACRTATTTISGSRRTIRSG